MTMDGQWVEDWLRAQIRHSWEHFGYAPAAFYVPSELWRTLYRHLMMKGEITEVATYPHFHGPKFYGIPVILSDSIMKQKHYRWDNAKQTMVEK